MIRIERLQVTFARGTPLETPALRGLDLTIGAGEFVTVIGSNGAGKSTLLNAVSGEVIPDAGRVLVDETDVTRWPAARRAGLVARVFQDPVAGSCAELTLEENLALAHARGRRRGLRRALGGARRDLFRERLAELGLGLEARLSERMDRLSGGQRQAVSLLMATLQPSRVLLLDEHTAALDPRTAEMVLELTRRVVAEHRLTTLMVTHSMGQALAAGSRTLMLHEGRIALDVSGGERAGMAVPDLVALFAQARRQALDDDSLLLG